MLTRPVTTHGPVSAQILGGAELILMSPVNVLSLRGLSPFSLHHLNVSTQFLKFQVLSGNNDNNGIGFNIIGFLYREWRICIQWLFC